MSSNIKVKKVCEYCKREFEARKTTSRTCSDKCAKKLYKDKKRAGKIETTIAEMLTITAKPVEDLKLKEFLSIDDTCKILGISRRTIYRMLKRGELKSGKAGTRTIIKRSELDNLFR